MLSPSRHHPEKLIINSKNQLLLKIVRNELIEKSNSQYASPIATFLKEKPKDKNSSLLNKKTIPRTFPISHPEEVFRKVKGAKKLSELDLQNGYFPVTRQA